MSHTNKYDDLKIEQEDPGSTYMIRAVLIVAALTSLVWYGVMLYSEQTITCASTDTKKLVSQVSYKDGSVECRYMRTYVMTKAEMQR